MTFPKENTLNTDVPEGSLDIPNLDGYVTLIGDFHIHTVFSDGSVSYKDRITEAYRDGLNVIAITDHNHYRFAPTKAFLIPSRNRLWQSAQEYAEEKGIILIKGLEFTRFAPPGHFCAIFLTDITKFNHISIMGNLREAKKQNSFVFWNHLYNYRLSKNGTYIWPVHEKMLKEGLFHGIEINGRTHEDALDLCLKNNLAVVATSDSHHPIPVYEDERHRRMTFIFARDKTHLSVYEALMERRVATYQNRIVYGEEKYLKELFEKAVSISNTRTGNSANFIFKNSSSLIFHIDINKDNEKNFTINPYGETSVIIELNDIDKDAVNFTVNNFRIGPGKALEYVVEM